MAASFLIRNATGILTGLRGDAARASGGDLRVRDGIIDAIGTLAPLPGERVFDATDCAVYPGWVNTHHHLFQTVLKAVPAGLDVGLLQWLSAVPVAYRKYVDEETLGLAATIGMAELLLSGCTTIGDHHYAYWPDMPFDSSAVLFDVADRLGVRFALLRGASTQAREIESDGPPEARPETFDAIIRSVQDDVARFHQPGGDAMRKVVLAPTTPTWSMPVGELREFARAGRSMGIKLHSHLSETADYVKYTREVYGKLPVEFVAEHEWLGPDVWFAHLVHVSPSEVKLLAETKTGMAHCSQCNARLGSGIAPAVELAAAGGVVTMGVDGPASNECADMTNEIRFAWHVHRATRGPKSLQMTEVVHWASRAGANLMGFDAVGALAPGMVADLAVYSLDNLRYAGLHDPVLGPVLSGGDARVKFAFRAGELVVSNGQIPGLDVPKLLADARAAVKRMAA